MIYTNYYESPLGSILLAGDEQGLTGLWFTEGARYIGLGLKKGARRCETGYFDKTKEWLDIYFSGRDPGFFPQIQLVGSDFRNRVGEIMCEIPFGKTVTYGWIADKLATERGLDRMSAQAVGGAVGHNPICIIIPCHRVIGSNGSLTGYPSNRSNIISAAVFARCFLRYIGKIVNSANTKSGVSPRLEYGWIIAKPTNTLFSSYKKNAISFGSVK